MSLKARLQIAIVALVVLVVSALSGLYLYSLAQSRFSDVVQRANMVAQQAKVYLIQRVTDRAAARPNQPADLKETKKIWTEIVSEDADLMSMLESAMANSHVIVEILIGSEEGRIIAASNRSRLGAKINPLPDLPEWEKKNSWRKLIEVFSHRRDYELVIPLGVAGEPNPVFTIHVVVSSILLREALTPLLWNTTLLLLAALGASMLLAVVVSNFTLRPLARISQTIDHIATGEFGKETEPAGTDTEAKEFQAVRTKLNVLGEQFRGAKEDVAQLRTNIEQLLQRLQEVVLLFDPEDHLVLAGRAAEQLLGRERWEMMGRPLSELFPPSSILGKAILAAADMRQSLRDYPVLLDRQGSPPVKLLVNVEVLEGFPNHERLGTLITLRDAESRYQIQSQLDISARLSAISRLTGGVAHEIKNPLNAMTVHLEILRSKLAAQGELVEPEIDTIAREITRLDRVVKTFLDFTRPVDLKMKELELGGLVQEIAALMGPASAKQNVRINVQTGGGQFLVHGDRDLLKQAILNVVANGVEAMKDGGELALQLGLVGDDCLLTISDGGPGIPAEIRDRIFNLYFSTKGKGSGIGLAVTFRVVQLHNGTIDFTSEPGQGTKFRLRFPVIQKDAGTPTVAVRPAEPVNTK